MPTHSCKHSLLSLSLCSTFGATLPVLAQTPQLEEVRVVGRSEGQKYYSGEAEVGRAEIPAREQPQSIRTISRQMIDDVGAVRLEEIYDFVSGISRQNSFGGMWDNFSIRGFSGDPNTGPNFLRNGFAGNRGFNAPRDMANIEKVEVLKGPAAVLYGGSEPGGILNVVTKKPKFKSGQAIEMAVGSFDNYRATVDLTGPLSESFAYRMNIAYEDRASFRDYVKSERHLIAPSFTWLLSSKTTLNYDLELLQHKAPFDRGVVAVNGRLGSVPDSRFLGEPNDGNITINNRTHQLSLEHDFSDDWKLKTGLGYRTTDLSGYSTEASPRTVGVVRFTTAGSPTIERERRFRDYSSEDLAFQSELHGKFQTAGLSHQMLIGVDSYRFELDQRVLRGRSTTTYGMNINDPVYGQAPLPLNTTPTNSVETQTNTGFFAQDQIAVAKNWRVLLGLRQDNFQQTVKDRNTSTGTTQHHQVTTPRMGLTWLATDTVAVYGQYSQSFRPNSGVDAQSKAFSPERANSNELGLKYESRNQRYGGTLAVFDTDKRNVLTNDPNNAGFSVAAGEARSRGVEFDFSGQITKSIRLTANYAFIEAEVTKDSNRQLVGARLINIPKHSGSILAMYENGLSNGTRYGLGGGATYVGKRAGNAVDSFELPDYTTARVVAYWKPNKTLRFSLDVDNLFNKTYYASSYDVYWITPGARRTVTLSMQAKF